VTTTTHNQGTNTQPQFHELQNSSMVTQSQQFPSSTVDFSAVSTENNEENYFLDMIL
jgi:hypothetical protein